MTAKKRNSTEQQNETVTTETVEVEAPKEQEQKTLSVVEQRAALRALGLKRCPGHALWWQWLPDEAKQPVEGQTDPSIRKLSEFGSSASCNACVKVRNAQHRIAANNVSGKPSQNVRRMVALVRKIDALQQQADALKAAMTEAEQDEAEQVYGEGAQ